jgi:hypothetical protein
MSTRPHSLIVASFLFAWFLPVSAFAGGPLAVCESGVPFLWPAGGASIPFNPDQGPLGPLDHAGAVAAVTAAFNVWGAVATSTASYVAGDDLPIDVNGTNFGPFLNPTAPDGLSAIVFDHTGEIFNLLFGPDSGVLGFAGPEWVNPTTCAILEGVSFLNGPSFTNLTAARDVMVHEFGHYSNLAHTVVNGQNAPNGFGDTSGPTPFNTFGNSPLLAIETMYPFYFGPGSGTQTLHKDDIAMISTLYPELSFTTTTGTIEGQILARNGLKLTGVNVTARNVADPFFDAVSAISSDFALSFLQTDPFTGVYTLRGLTPGASYAVFVDQILAGGFSTPPSTLRGPEEFWNGPNESDGMSSPDEPDEYVPVVTAAGATTSGVTIIFNAFRPGDVLPVGDDGFVEIPLPFSFRVCGQSFDTVFINANGSLTFGAGSGDFTESTPEFLAGPPRIAGLWDDLNAAAGGSVTFDENDNSFTARWDAVPEFPAAGSNTFAITLRRSENSAAIGYGDLSATDGLAGLSCGGAVTSGFELETELRTVPHHRTINMHNLTAVFQQFSAADNDLDGDELKFVHFKQGFDDVFESNDSIAAAKRIHLPFSTQDVDRFSSIDPVGGDVDYYRFSVKAGDILAIELVRGGFDTTLGLFDVTTGDLLAFDDDSGLSLLSRMLVRANADLDLAVAVSAYPDLDFNGDGGGGGRYVLYVNRYRGEVLPAGDDTSTEVPIPFFFPYQGTRWTSVFVNSNGNLTFDVGSADLTESVEDFLNGPPRIAALWDDLDARGGLVVAERTPISLTVHYVSVPEFFSTSPNYFSTTLLVGGFTVLDWGPTARSDALVGLTGGGGAADPGETDLSGTLLLRTNRTTYDIFPPEFVVLGDDGFDLSFLTRLGVPF